jgi:hypothetical protein
MDAGSFRRAESIVHPTVLAGSVVVEQIVADIVQRGIGNDVFVTGVTVNSDAVSSIEGCGLLWVDLQPQPTLGSGSRLLLVSSW